MVAHILEDSPINNLWVQPLSCSAISFPLSYNHQRSYQLPCPKHRLGWSKFAGGFGCGLRKPNHHWSITPFRKDWYPSPYHTGVGYMNPELAQLCLASIRNRIPLPWWGPEFLGIFPQPTPRTKQNLDIPLGVKFISHLASLLLPISSTI